MEREPFIAGDRRYEIRLEMEKWYELWRDGNRIGYRYQWTIDPDTERPFTKNELVDVTTQMCIELEQRKLRDWNGLRIVSVRREDSQDVVLSLVVGSPTEGMLD